MITLQELETFFGLQALIHTGLLLYTIIMIRLLPKWAIKIHTKLFRVSEKYVMKVFYGILAVYKILIIVFAIVPWLALKFLR